MHTSNASLLQPIFVEELDPHASSEWDAYVDGRPDATCYHLRAWQSAAERAYRMSAPHLVARRGPGGPLAGVLPLFVVRRPLARYVTNGLFGAYGPLLSESPEAAQALLHRAQQVAAENGASFVQLKLLGDSFQAEGFARHDLSVVATLRLDAHPEEVWARIGDSMRAKVRKARKHGITVHDEPGGLGEFYEVLASNMHRRGFPIYGLPFLQVLVAELGARAEVLTLRHGGRTISGALVIHYNGVTSVPFVSSLEEAFHLRPNNLLYWEIITRACRRGMHTLDFGKSPVGATTLQFKQSWGAVVQPQPYFIHQRGRAAPRIDASGAGMQQVVRLWQRLPRKVVDTLGPKVSKWIA
jgi:FemAB-related protein (PEP-CTERM system-associated)